MASDALPPPVVRGCCQPFQGGLETFQGRPDFPGRLAHPPQRFLASTPLLTGTQRGGASHGSPHCWRRTSASGGSAQRAVTRVELEVRSARRVLVPRPIPTISFIGLSRTAHYGASPQAEARSQLASFGVQHLRPGAGLQYSASSLPPGGSGTTFLWSSGTEAFCSAAIASMPCSAASAMGHFNLLLPALPTVCSSVIKRRNARWAR